MLDFQTYGKFFGIVFSLIILISSIRCNDLKSNQLTISTPKADSIRVWVQQSRRLEKSNPQKTLLLKQASQKAREISRDSLKSKCFSEISLALTYTNDNIEFRRINREAMYLAERIKDSTSMASLNWDLADFYSRTDVRDSTYFYFAKAERIYTALGHEENSAILLRSMARVQNLIGDFTGSNNTTIKAIEKLKPLHKYEQLYKSYSQLADNAKLLDEYERSLEYYKKTLTYLQKSDLEEINLLSVKHNMGLVYQKQGHHKKAIIYFSEVLANDSLRIKNPSLFGRALTNLGRSKLQINDFEQLPDLFLQAIEFQEISNDIGGQVSSNFELAQYHLVQKDSIAAFANLSLAKEMAIKIKSNRKLLEIYRLFSKVDAKSATNYTETYATLNEELLRQERQIRGKFARIRFETDEFIAENQLLTRKKQLWIGIAAAILLLGLSTFIIVNQRVKNQKLLFREQQQASNQEIFNLLLAHKEKVQEGKKLEQKRVSEELHDGVLGRMLGTRMMLLGLNKKTSPEAIAERAKAIAILQDVESEVRAISHELSDSAYQKINDFVVSIQELLKTVETSSKVNINFNYAEDLDYDALNGDIKINLYRIIQESIQNAVKHADCDNINLRFDADAKDLRIIINDDGKGFVIKKGKKGIGTRNIASRMKKVNGTWFIDSTIGKGTSVNLNIPIPVNNHLN